MQYINIDKQVGKVLQDLRKKKNISQKQLGDIIDVTPQQIYKYESGKSSINISFLYSICKRLDISMCELEGQILSLSHNKNLKYHILEISKLCKTFENVLNKRDLASLQNAIAFIITVSNSNINNTSDNSMYFNRKPIFQIR